jgi:uncharacterized protein YdhG (YjbR/CyaY superfamily)
MYEIAISYPLQHRPKAREHLARLRADGLKAWMTLTTPTTRHGAKLVVHFMVSKEDAHPNPASILVAAYQRVASAADSFLGLIDNLTPEQFERGEERVEREQLRVALDLLKAACHD